MVGKGLAHPLPKIIDRGPGLENKVRVISADDNENVKKCYRFKLTKQCLNFAGASRLFVHFLLPSLHGYTT